MLQNADPDVRVDMETFLNTVVPEVMLSPALLSSVKLSAILLLSGRCSMNERQHNTTGSKYAALRSFEPTSGPL